MKLYIIRHGETDENVAGIVQGWLDTNLNEKGVAQAIKVAANFDKSIDAIYSSDLRRATKTAHEFTTLHPNIPYYEDARLRERDYGDISGKRRNRRDYEQLWSSEEIAASLNVESVSHFTNRVATFLSDIKSKPYESVLIVAHAGVLNRIQAIIDPSHKNQVHANASILEVDI